MRDFGDFGVSFVATVAGLTQGQGWGEKKRSMCNFLFFKSSNSFNLKELFETGRGYPVDSEEGRQIIPETIQAHSSALQHKANHRDAARDR